LRNGGFLSDGIEGNCPIFARFSHTDIISSSILNTTIYIMIIEIFANERREHLTQSRCSPKYVIIPSPTYSNRIPEQEYHVQILKADGENCLLQACPNR